jgi:hypothetical protein
MITITPEEYRSGEPLDRILIRRDIASQSHHVPRRPKKDGAPIERGSGGLQRASEAILERLRQTGAIMDWWHSEDRKKRERPGMPDLVIGVRPGLVIAVELKSRTGRATEEQERWLECWGERGALCRSVEEVLTFLKQHQVIA